MHGAEGGDPGVEPACHVQGKCDIAMLNPISFVAYRDFFAQGANIDLQYVPGQGATLGQAWTKPLYVDDYGMAVIGGTPEDFKALIEDGIARYGAIIRAAGIQPE